VLLRVKNLSTTFIKDNKIINALNNISFSIPEEKIVCIVGESGCGKTVTALSILNLIKKPGKIINGKVMFEGQDILNAKSNIHKKIRGNKISIMLESGKKALNPSYTIGYQINEVIKLHQKHLNKQERYEKVIDVLKLVRMPNVKAKYNEYVQNITDSQAQRVLLAIAMACEPTLLIADNPTNSLDVTLQAQFLELIYDLKETRGTSILFITHNLAIVSQIADEVIVMYKGHIIEKASAQDLFTDPKHPYTKVLLNSLPVYQNKLKKNKLNTIDLNIDYLKYEKEIR